MRVVAGWLRGASRLCASAAEQHVFSARGCAQARCQGSTGERRGKRGDAVVRVASPVGREGDADAAA